MHSHESIWWIGSFLMSMYRIVLLRPRRHAAIIPSFKVHDPCCMNASFGARSNLEACQRKPHNSVY